MDKRDSNFYEKLSTEEKKGFQPLILMKYMSSVPNGQTLPYLALVTTNEMVNKNFWELTSEPELQSKLLALCGTGQKTYHKWLPFNNKKTQALTEFVKDIFRDKNWSCNSFEVDLFLSNMNEENVKDLCRDYGKTKDEEKKIITEFRKLCV